MSEKTDNSESLSTLDLLLVRLACLTWLGWWVGWVLSRAGVIG